MAPNPLHDTTRAAGAVWGELEGHHVPLRFTDPQAEALAARRGAGLRHASHLGRILASGPDHLDFLHRMTTNHLLSVPPGAGAESVFVDSRGRILDLGAFYRTGGQTLIVLSPGAAGPIAAWLDRFVFAEDLALRDVTEQTAMVELAGPQAGRLAHQALGIDLAAAAPHQVLDAGEERWLLRCDHIGAPGLRACGRPEAMAALWTALASAGASPIGEEAWEILRVEEGTPARGRELTEEHNPWEAGLERAVHLAKGCYIGQEVVARLEAYDKVKQRLAGLVLDAGALPSPGSRLSAGGKEAGIVTSAVLSPALGRAIALAYVRRAFCAPGTRLTWEDRGEARQAVVAPLPFTPPP
ncbi:MAG: aminomethyltransferase family protein [Candidatus Latescibacterota bacterium]